MLKFSAKGKVYLPAQLKITEKKKTQRVCILVTYLQPINTSTQPFIMARNYPMQRVVGVKPINGTKINFKILISYM